MAGSTIKAVLFDSGDTLLEPMGGTWWPRPAMRTLLDRLSSPIEPDRLDAAQARGMEFLDAHHYVETEDDEIAQFRRYYAIVLSELGLDATSEVIERLAQSEVFDLKQSLFPDTLAALEELHRAGLKLGILSNAWPSLERVYRMLGLRHFFDPFIISSQLGCFKPDPRMYRVAIKLLGLEPSSILFVDDDIEYVRAAELHGLRGTVLRRAGTPASAEGTIATLDELKALIWPR
ncbi:MAG: HAD family hydrolase [Candidatus Binataceae bacterium]